MKSLLVAAAMAAVCVPAAAQSGSVRPRSVDEIWSAYQRRWAETETYAATFRQRIEIEGIGGEVESAGNFYFAKPDRMRWDYLEGQPQNVVGDGRWIWVYQPDLEQVYRVDYETAFGAGGLVALLADRQGLASRYRLSLLDSDENVVRVRLVPKADVGETLELSMTPDTLELRSVVIRDPAGSVTIVEFEQVRRNVALDDTLFSFQPPDGVDIITSGPPSPS